jgi:hypothetical protein
MCVLVYSCFSKNPLIRSRLTTCLSEWECYTYVLMRNKLGKIIALDVGPHHKRSKTCVWVPKCLVTNLRGPNQTWVPKTKA